MTIWKTNDIMAYFQVSRMAVKMWRDKGLPFFEKEEEGGEGAKFTYDKQEVIKWVHTQRSKNYSAVEFEQAVEETARVIAEERVKELKVELRKEFEGLLIKILGE